MRHIKLILSLFLLPLVTLADVAVTARLDSTQILIGEQVRLHAEVKVPQKTRVAFPEFQNGFIVDSVEVLERSKIDTATLADGRWQLSRSYLLTSFDSALYQLPPIEVTVGKDTFRSANVIALKVNTIPVDSAAGEETLFVKGVADLPFTWTPEFFVEGLLLWLFIGIWFFSALRLMNRKPMTKKVVIAPPPPAHRTALSTLEKFKGRATDTLDETKHYYMELTDVLRTYIHDRFGFNAKEMTSAEIVTNLLENGDSTALADLRELLQMADLVKFAKQETSMTENDRSLLKALEYVQQTADKAPQTEPKVEIVTVGDVKQVHIRRVTKVVAVLSGLAALACAGWMMYRAWLAFA